MDRFTGISKKFSMIFKNYLFFLFFLFLSFNSSANIINDQISSKYDQIFSDKLLSNSDIKSYKKIFELQESCKWKQQDEKSSIERKMREEAERAKEELNNKPKTRRRR